MKQLLTTLIFFVTSQLAISQNTILWKVTNPNNNKTSFIVGTFHQLGNSFVDSIPQIKQSLINSELAIFELIGSVEKTREIIESREASFEIEKRLRKRDLKKLKAIAKNWKVNLYKLKPIEVESKLIRAFQKTKCKTVKPTDTFDHFDNYLIHIAKKNNIEILGLENNRFQLDFISKIAKHSTWKKSKKIVRAWIHEMTTDKPNMNNCNLANKYRAFNLDYNFKMECKNTPLLVQRNNNWMKTLPNLLKTKNTFIAVGYSHLTKKCGIIEQLRNKGFKIIPVKLTPVVN